MSSDLGSDLPAWGAQQFSAVVEPFPAHDWRVVRVPDPPRATHPWGRTPVTASLTTPAGITSTWPTSTCRHRGFGTVLMLPRELQAEPGATVTITLQPRALDDAPPRPRRRRRD